MPIRTGIFKYVIHSLIDDYHKMGWFITSDLDCHHGVYSVLMWHCGCKQGETI